jgi:DNA-directed RNA polymerase subunit RPC12/RpoP
MTYRCANCAVECDDSRPRKSGDGYQDAFGYVYRECTEYWCADCDREYPVDYEEKREAEREAEANARYYAGGWHD